MRVPLPWALSILKAQRLALALGALAYGAQAQVARELPLGVEDHAVVAYPQQDLSGSELHARLHVRGAGVLDGVVGNGAVYGDTGNDAP